MDAISLHQSGFKKVVSTMGTAVTDEQINYLIKLSLTSSSVLMAIAQV